ncbi:probable transcription factor VIP1 at C-terminar half [Coccomyxa sp. Obi]|nr:probable transcription factor VIP1 at C-terminar half [Coccomyxa sp. Obi]
MDPLSQLQNAFLGDYDISLPQEFSSQADMLNDLLRQRQFQSSPNLQTAPKFGTEESPDMMQQGTGADAPGSDSLTQEEQVSSLTMAAFDECLLNVDLPALNIPRPGTVDDMDGQSSPISAHFATLQGLDLLPPPQGCDMDRLLPPCSPRNSPGTPQAAGEAGNAHGGKAPAAAIQVAAVGCAAPLTMCPPGMPPLPGQLLCAGGPSRSQSLPVLHNALNSSPGTPQARGDTGVLEQEQCSALAANAAAQAALWSTSGTSKLADPDALQHGRMPGGEMEDVEAIHRAYLTPAHKRKGKGGRQPAADPRLDPGIDPKRARRILANRLSAARSKMKQKSHVEALRRKVEILTFHKSNLAAEIEKLRAACNRRASHNSVLKMKLDELRAHCAMLVRTHNALVEERNRLLLAAGYAPRPVASAAPATDAAVQPRGGGSDHCSVMPETPEHEAMAAPAGSMPALQLSSESPVVMGEEQVNKSPDASSR